MNLNLLVWLANPITWLVAMMMVAGWSRAFGRRNIGAEDAARIVNVGSTSPDAMGAALLFMVMAHRPNHEFVAKAQIRQMEDAEDDDEGGPDTARRHLMRQLRQIRRGEAVDRLVWRLE
jgi:hypothetical protein